LELRFFLPMVTVKVWVTLAPRLSAPSCTLELATALLSYRVTAVTSAPPTFWIT